MSPRAFAPLGDRSHRTAKESRARRRKPEGVALRWVTDADERVKELRAASVALLKLLERPQPATIAWHDKVRAAVERVNALYPVGMVLR